MCSGGVSAGEALFNLFLFVVSFLLLLRYLGPYIMNLGEEDEYNKYK